MRFSLRRLRTKPKNPCLPRRLTTFGIAALLALLSAPIVSNLFLSHRQVGSGMVKLSDGKKGFRIRLTVEIRTT